MFTYMKIIVHFKYIQFVICQLNINKCANKRKYLLSSKEWYSFSFFLKLVLDYEQLNGKTFSKKWNNLWREVAREKKHWKLKEYFSFHQFLFSYISIPGSVGSLIEYLPTFILCVSTLAQDNRVEKNSFRKGVYFRGKKIYYFCLRPHDFSRY